jgi:hypothetical protein
MEAWVREDAGPPSSRARRRDRDPWRLRPAGPFYDQRERIRQPYVTKGERLARQHCHAVSWWAVAL